MKTEKNKNKIEKIKMITTEIKKDYGRKRKMGR